MRAVRIMKFWVRTSLNSLQIEECTNKWHDVMFVMFAVNQTRVAKQPVTVLSMQTVAVNR